MTSSFVKTQFKILAVVIAVVLSMQSVAFSIDSPSTRFCIILQEVPKIKEKDFVDPENPTPEELAALAAYQAEISLLETLNTDGRQWFVDDDFSQITNAPGGLTIYQDGKAKNPCRLITLESRRIPDKNSLVASIPFGIVVLHTTTTDEPVEWFEGLGFTLAPK